MDWLAFILAHAESDFMAMQPDEAGQPSSCEPLRRVKSATQLTPPILQAKTILTPDCTGALPLRFAEDQHRAHEDGDSERRFDGTFNTARFVDYIPSTRRVRIRVQDSRVPEFWLSISFTMEQLSAFTAMAATRPASDEDHDRC